MVFSYTFNSIYTRVAFMYLYVSVREQQVHDDVLGQNLRVVDA